MPTVQVDQHPLNITAVSGETVTVTHVGGATTHYGRTFDVDATDNVGSLAVGDTVTLTDTTRWFIAPTGGAYLTVTRTPPVTAAAAIRSDTTAIQNIQGHVTLSENKKLVLTTNTPAGGISRLIEFRMTTEMDRPWISWFDELGLHRAAFGYHTTDVISGNSHQAVEIKTVAADGVDMRTRLSIGTKQDRITVGFASCDTLEVFQGDNAPNVQFGLNLRAAPAAQDVGVANAVIGVFTAQLDAADHAFGNIDIKPPYVSGSAAFPGNKTATLNFFRNTNSASASSPQIAIKKGDGTNTNAFVLNAKAGTLSAASGIAAFGVAPPTARPAVTGSRAANAALASLLTALAATGLVTDSSTA